jgi:DnaK suppressor protein
MAAKKKTASKVSAKPKTAGATNKKPAPNTAKKTSEKTAGKSDNKADSKASSRVTGKAVTKPAAKPASKPKPANKVKKTATHTVPVKNAPIASEPSDKTSSKKVSAEKNTVSVARRKPRVAGDQLQASSSEPPAKGSAAIRANTMATTKTTTKTKEPSVKEKSVASNEPTKPAKRQPTLATVADNPVVQPPKSQKKTATGKPGAKQDVISKAQKTDNKTIVAKNTARVIELQEPPYHPSTGPIHGIPPYQPKTGEEYMSEGQLEHFRQILNNWKQELMEEVDRTIHHLRDEATNFPDPNDRATQESEFGLELRARDRERKLLKKIDAALERIEDGSYGYCEETGEEIGLRRLEARPIATLCLEAQERHELVERHYGEREDRFR